MMISREASIKPVKTQNTLAINGMIEFRLLKPIEKSEYGNTNLQYRRKSPWRRQKFYHHHCSLLILFIIGLEIYLYEFIKPVIACVTFTITAAVTQVYAFC